MKLNTPIMGQKAPFGSLLLSGLHCISVVIKQYWPRKLGHAVEFAAIVEMPACRFEARPMHSQRRSLLLTVKGALTSLFWPRGPTACICLLRHDYG